jgi:hypothetical protein
VTDRDDAVVTPRPAPGTYGHSRVLVGEPLPAVLVLSDLAELLGVGSTTVFAMYKRGDFKRFELAKVGNRPRFSGRKVQEWLDGTSPADADDPAEGRRYFTAGRRARLAAGSK